MHRLWRSILVFHPPFGWCFHQRWEGLHQRWEEPILSILQCRRRQLQWWETGLQQDERTILRKAMRGTEVLPCITIQWQLYCRTIVDFGIALHRVQRFISFHIVSKFRNYLHHGVRNIAALGHHVCWKKADRRMKKRTGRGLVWTPGHFPVVSFNWPNKDMERSHKITNFNNFMTQEILPSKQTWWNGQCMFKCWMFNGSFTCSYPG